MTAYHAGLILAGLGLFFVGMEMLTSSLRNLAGRTVQQSIGRYASSIPLGFLWGAIGGAITQSTSVATFIIIGLLVARMIEVRNALPMIIGANIGSSLLLFIVSLDLETAALLLIGIAGIATTLDRLRDWRSFIKAALGVALLLYGLTMIKQGTIPMMDTPTFAGAFSLLEHSLEIAFVIGAALTFAIQSSIAMGALAMTFMDSGAMTFQTTVMVIYASNFGSSVTTFVLAAKLRGQARQLAMYQFWFNVVGCIVLVPLLYLELQTGIPMMLALLEALSQDAQRQIAWAFLLFNTTAAIVLLAAIGPSARLLERVWPTSPAEDAARPAYISPLGLSDPAVGLRLVLREQERLAIRLPEYVAAIRDPGPRIPDAVATRHEPTQSVSREINHFLDDLTTRSLSAEDYDRVHEAQDRQTRLGAVSDLLNDFVLSVSRSSHSTSIEHLRNQMIEGLDAILLGVSDAITERDASALELAAAITGDRSSLMQSLRRTYLTDETAALGPDDKLFLLQLTGKFERLVWSLNGLITRWPRGEEAEPNQRDA